VKRNWIIILSLMAMVIIITHDIIPHFHDESGDKEIFSGHLSYQHDHGKTNHNHRNHLPLHQHAFSDNDFLVQRSALSLNKIYKDLNQEYGCIHYPIIEFKTFLLIAGSILEIKEPLNYKNCMLPCNLTRGSPVIS